MKLDVLYAHRFDDADETWKRQVWAVLWRRVFARLVRPEDVLVDVGGGYCELVNAAVARRRIVVDMNPRTHEYAAPGVEVHVASAERMTFLRDGEADVVFSSNFFEHLPGKPALVRTVQEIARVLRPGGRVIAVGPNVRLMPTLYWDYFDHHIPLSDRSLCELLAMCDLAPEHVDPRFIPATVKSRLPRWPALVEAYLSARPLSSLLFGKQFLVVARKPEHPAATR
jgi:SAM-dependent methyltransferase